jgi:hypothetical protein
MRPFSKLKIFFWLHSHEYEKILGITVCDLFDTKESTEKIRAHAVAAFYLESYFDARKHYEILVKRHKATAMDYVRLAYIYARHNQKENAIISWCKALEINKRQKIAKNILAHIKEKGREIGMFEDDYIRKVSTKRPIFIPFKSIFQGTVAGGVLAVFLFFAFTQGPKLYRELRLRHYRSDINKVMIDEFNPTVLSDYHDEDKQYSYKEPEVRKMFDTAKEKIMTNDDNQAIVLMNKLKFSNASENVKSKVEYLKGFLQVPDYSNFKSNFDYQTIKNEPAVYDGVYILWHGKIANSATADGKTVFNLVLGDEEAGYIDAIIPVTFTKPVIAENKTFARIFGQIKVLENQKIKIDGRILIRD